MLFAVQRPSGNIDGMRMCITERRTKIWSIFARANKKFGRDEILAGLLHICLRLQYDELSAMSCILTKTMTFQGTYKSRFLEQCRI